MSGTGNIVLTTILFLIVIFTFTIPLVYRRLNNRPHKIPTTVISTIRDKQEVKEPEIGPVKVTITYMDGTVTNLIIPAGAYEMEENDNFLRFTNSNDTIRVDTYIPINVIRSIVEEVPQ